jgi:hypothetical protein
MSVYPSEIIFYGCVNMPEADGATVGGAIDLTRRVSFSDNSATGLFDAVSSASGDTATKIIYSGRDATGLIQTETLTLTGTTKVAGTKTLQRLLYAALSGASATGPLANPGGTAATGDVALMSHTLVITAHTAQAGSAQATGVTPPLFHLQAGDGASMLLGHVIHTTGGTGSGQLRYVTAISGYGTDFVATNRPWTTLPDATTTYEVATGMVFDLLPNPVTSITRPFATIAADVSGGSSRTFNEKIFCLNTDASTALSTASILKQTDPGGGGTLNFALCTALNDTATATNRQTAPSGIGSYSSGAAPQTIACPNNLPSGNTSAGAQGVWLQFVLPAGTAATNTSFTMRGTGSTT